MQITILGAGKLGTNIAQALLLSGHDITIVDKDSELIQRIRSRLDLRAVSANAKNMEVLRDIKVDESDLLIACTDDDDKNMVLCSLAKTMGVGRCIARVRSPEYIAELETLREAMNIDRIINPDFECANEIRDHLLCKHSFEEGVETVNGISIMEFAADRIAGLTGKTLQETALFGGDLLAGAISRSGKIIIPNGLTEILEDDKIFALGDSKSIMQLYDTVHEKKTGHRANHVMIAGGGKTGFFLASSLLAEGIDVRIIEEDLERAQYLADKLPEAMLTRGDATDEELLLEEGFEDMDAFVACTGFDEENLMLALLGKQHGIENVIAKLTRQNYGPIMDMLGDTMTINPVQLCTAGVIRYMNSDRNIIFSKTVQGQAEFTEIDVREEMPIANKTLSDIKPGQGILLAAINRNGNVMIPNGSTLILPGDKLIVLSLISKIPELETLFKKGSSGEF